MEEAVSILSCQIEGFSFTKLLFFNPCHIQLTLLSSGSPTILDVCFSSEKNRCFDLKLTILEHLQASEKDFFRKARSTLHFLPLHSTIPVVPPFFLAKPSILFANEN